MAGNPAFLFNQSPERFSSPLLAWFDHSGRKTLPWQQNRTPYRVWVSEIMLQQTQVTAVIPFFNRFMEKFPSIQALAAANSDVVMHHWSGLGYYARARNLHKAAKLIIGNHDGQFPDTLEEAVALPGIGRSTAGAILAFCMDQRHPILDGNVKRVLTRHFAIPGYPGQSAVEKHLWQLAETLTPRIRVADYTQAIMDLGATVCTRTKPMCDQCPVVSSCQSHRQGNQTDYPHRKPKKSKPTRFTRLLIARNANHQVLLEKRPPTGIWGGLWSMPELPEDGNAEEFALSRFGLDIDKIEPLKHLRHGFTHFDLEIEPILCLANTSANRIMDADHLLWYNLNAPQAIGLPAVISKLLGQITAQ